MTAYYLFISRWAKTLQGRNIMEQQQGISEGISLSLFTRAEMLTRYLLLCHPYDD